jgi:hypothetical protein
MTNPRQLKFVERPDFAGWTCSNCNWIFNIPDLKSGSLDRLIAEAEALRDKAFASHNCSDYPTSSNAKRR